MQNKKKNAEKIQFIEDTKKLRREQESNQSSIVSSLTGADPEFVFVGGGGGGGA